MSDCTQMQTCRAQLDQVIAANRHNPQILKAMADWDAELHLQMVDGKPTLQSAPTADSRILKQKGSGLALTPQDMVTCQVADGICATMGDVRRSLGIEAWEGSDKRGAEIIASLSQTPASQTFTIPSEPERPSDPARDTLTRDEAYYKARAAEQERAYEARRKEQERAYAERQRRDELQRQAEDRAALREQNRRDQERKRRDMDSVGRHSGW